MSDEPIWGFTLVPRPQGTLPDAVRKELLAGATGPWATVDRLRIGEHTINPARARSADSDRWDHLFGSGDAGTVSRPAAPESGAARSSTRDLTSATHSPGTTLHKWVIDRLLAQGGSSNLYLALDNELGQRVVLKELRADSYSSDASLEWALHFMSREAGIGRDLKHEGIVRTFEFFKAQGASYIVLEYLDGPNLQVWARDRGHNISNGEVQAIVHRLASALSYMHSKGYVHGDIKPSNVMIDSQGKPVLIDLGSAQRTDSSEGDAPIEDFGVTLPFTSPEQLSGSTPPHPRWDVFALAATLYWLVSGREIVDVSGNARDVLKRRIHGDTKPLQSILPPEASYSERFVSAITRGLSLDPARRYVSIPAFIEDMFPGRPDSSASYVPTPRGDRIFVSYRRDDVPHFAGRVLDALELRFGQESVFFDVDSIPIGTTFWDHIQEVLSGCAVVLAVVGPNWWPTRRKGRVRSRSAPEHDYVEMEIAVAAQLKVPIIPVLAEGASLPQRRDLGEQLQFIPDLNAAILGAGRDFRGSARALGDQIERWQSEFRRIDSASSAEVQANLRQPEGQVLSGEPRGEGNTMKPGGRAADSREPLGESRDAEAESSTPVGLQVDHASHTTTIARSVGDVDFEATAGQPKRAADVNQDPRTVESEERRYDYLFDGYIPPGRSAKPESEEPERGDVASGQVLPADRSLWTIGTTADSAKAPTGDAELGRVALSSLIDAVPWDADDDRSDGPTVLAGFCSDGHPTPPYSSSCRVCGKSVAAQPAVEIQRPALGALRVSSGETVCLDRGVVIGREPTAGSEGGEAPHLLRVESPMHDVSRTHAEIVIDGWHVLVQDLGSTNGTTVLSPGRELALLRARELQVLEPGAVISLGGEVEISFEVTP